MSFLAALEIEIEALERSLRESPDPRVVKLHELQRVRAIYGGGAIATTSWAVLGGQVSTEVKTGKQPGRRTSPERQRAIDIVKEILAGETVPMRTSALLRRIMEKGIEIGGQNPANNLSAMLYNNSKEFLSHGRAGWTLATTPPPAKLAENISTADLLSPGGQQSAADLEPNVQGRDASQGGGT